MPVRESLGAVTGDGANDAPAIRLAGVGIALGQRGTPAAKAAADLVVTDDRLETMIAALECRGDVGVRAGGAGHPARRQRGEVAFSAPGSVLTGRSLLGRPAAAAVNLLTDLAPALVIALSCLDGSAVPDLLREAPSASPGAPPGRDITARASTVTLASPVATQLGQTLVAGGKDRTVLVAGPGSAVVLGGVIQTPGVSQSFGCTPLGPIGWGIALSSAAANLACPLVTRLLPSPG